MCNFLSGFLLFETTLANAGEAKLTPGDLTAAALLCRLGEGIGDLHGFQVDDCAAVIANEVYMGTGISVEPFHAGHGRNAHCQALLLEQIQVPIPRTHGKVGDLGLQLLKQRLGRGMLLGHSQTVEDGVPLAEMLCDHVATSFLNENDSYLHLDYIMPIPICQ